jgi:hypothetical protein
VAASDLVDLDIRFERSGQDYKAVVVNSPVGQGFEVHFRRPVDDKDLELFVLKMTRGAGLRRIDTPQAARAKELGYQLFEALFHGDLLVCLRDSLHEAARGDHGLRIRLRLGATPELSNLPWEYLYDRQFNRFLCLSDLTPVVRYPEMLEPVRPLRVDGPLRVLVMVSSPSDYPSLDVEQEWAKVKEALGDLEDAGRIQLELLPDATLGSLRRQLRRREYHALHFIGHGGFDDTRGEGVLVLTERDGTGCWVSGERLGIDLHDAASLRLVVLNACEGARSDANDPFSGVAQSLVQQGIPAVVAMQFEITDAAAIAFTHGFYGAAADGMPIDASMGQARKDIHDISALEWATPVLYLRASDGRIFQFASSASSEAAQLKAAEAPGEQALAREQARREAEEQAHREAEHSASTRSTAKLGPLEWTRQDREMVQSYRQPDAYHRPEPTGKDVRIVHDLGAGGRSHRLRRALIVTPLVLVTTVIVVQVVRVTSRPKVSSTSSPTVTINPTPTPQPSNSTPTTSAAAGSSTPPNQSPTIDPLQAALSTVSRQGYTVNVTGTFRSNATLRVLLGVKESADRHDERAFFFVKDWFIGWDASQPSPAIRWVSQIDDTTVALEYPLYASQDTVCRPTGATVTIYFLWDGHLPLKQPPGSATPGSGCRSSR